MGMTKKSVGLGGMLPLRNGHLRGANRPMKEPPCGSSAGRRTDDEEEERRSRRRRDDDSFVGSLTGSLIGIGIASGNFGGGGGGDFGGGGGGDFGGGGASGGW